MIIPEETDYLFVYGTLMHPFDNPWSQLLRNESTFIGEGFFPGKLVLVSWYPGALYIPDFPGYVYGEIYKMNNPKFLVPLLDDYEEINSIPQPYQREVIMVSTEEGKFYPCWVYIYRLPIENLQVIPEGRFHNHSI